MLCQGTNAHTILRQAPAAALLTPATAAPWRPRRFWCSARTHAALRRAISQPDEPAVVMHADLQSAAAAHLSDCMVSPAAGPVLGCTAWMLRYADHMLP